MKFARRRFPVGIIASVLFFAMAAGCTPVKREETDSRSLQETASSELPSEEKETIANFKPIYRKISSVNGLAMTENGLYQLVDNENDMQATENIVYIDFSAMHRSYLMDNADGQQTKNDISSFPFSYGGSEILFDDGYLYIFEEGSLLMQNKKDESARACIYRMNPDGKNQIRLAFPWHQAMKNAQDVFICDESMYFIMYIVEMDGATHEELVRADLSSMSTEILMDFSNEEWDLHRISLVSSFQDKLVISSSKAGNSSDIEPEEKLFAIDPIGKTVTPLLDIQKDWTVFYRNGDIYYLDTSDNSVYSYDPASGEHRIVIPQAVPEGVEYDTIQIGYTMPDSYISFRFVKNNENRDYFYNSDTGEWKEVLLADRYQEVYIFGIWSHFFLVNLYDKKVYDQNGVEDSSSANPMYVPLFALIDQDDYWNGVPNYLYFEDDVYGN